MLLSIFIRTVIIYVILTITMRIMGKRQLGELDVSELVIAILLSEIASLPITNEEKPLMRQDSREYPKRSHIHSYAAPSRPVLMFLLPDTCPAV